MHPKPRRLSRDQQLRCLRDLNDRTRIEDVLADAAGADPGDKRVEVFGQSIAFEKIARDHELLHLAGAFVDAEDAHVAIEALDTVIAT